MVLLIKSHIEKQAKVNLAPVEQHEEDPNINEAAFRIEIEDSESDKWNSESKHDSNKKINEVNEEFKHLDFGLFDQ